MERAIGEIFESDGKKLKVIKDDFLSCKGCFFYINNNCDTEDDYDYVGECSDYFRKDGKSVIFKLLEE